MGGAIFLLICSKDNGFDFLNMLFHGIEVWNF